MVITSAVNNI